MEGGVEIGLKRLEWMRVKERRTEKMSGEERRRNDYGTKPQKGGERLNKTIQVD